MSITSGPIVPGRTGKVTGGVPSEKVRVAVWSVIVMSLLTQLTAGAVRPVRPHPDCPLDGSRSFAAAAPAPRRRALAGPIAGPTDRCRPAPAAARAPASSGVADRRAARVEKPLEDQIVLEQAAPAAPAQAGQLARSHRHRPRPAPHDRPLSHMRSKAADSHRALDHQLLDLADRLRRVEPLRADVDAVHDRVAAEQPVRILEVVEPLAGRLVARVGDEAVGLRAGRPGRRTCPGSTRTTGRRSSSRRTGCTRRGRRAPRAPPATAGAPSPAAASSLTRYGLIEWYCLKNWLMSTIRSRITGSPGSGRSTTGSFSVVQVGDAGEAVLAVDVHRVGAAHALAAASGGSDSVSSTAP